MGIDEQGSASKPRRAGLSIPSIAAICPKIKMLQHKQREL
jgi:hypothetical protein